MGAASARATLGITIATIVAYLALSSGGPHLIYQAGFIPVRAFEGSPFDFAVPFLLTPLSATLMHAGLLHIGFNLLMLVFCGRAVEGLIGPGRLLIVYVAGAYGAALAQYLVEPASPVPMIGASGAISALVAVYAMVFSRGNVRAVGALSGQLVRALWLAAAWIGIQWLVGAATGGGESNVATAAHVGGFLTGLMLVRPLLGSRFLVRR